MVVAGWVAVAMVAMVGMDLAEVGLVVAGWVAAAMVGMVGGEKAMAAGWGLAG